MKIALITTIICIVLFGLYLVAMNSVATLIYNKGIDVPKEESGISNLDLELGVSDNVEVSVKRNRWYGVIYENISKDRSISTLYLFHMIKIPLEVNGTSYAGVHIVVSIILLIGLILLFIFDVVVPSDDSE